jgi:hypothetical protein
MDESGGKGRILIEKPAPTETGADVEFMANETGKESTACC